MDITQKPPALDCISIESSDNIVRPKLQHTKDLDTLENDDKTIVSTITSLADVKEQILAAAAEQHKFVNRACVNATLCDLCRKCIGDIITGDCFVESASKRSSRWTCEKTPTRWNPTELSFRFYEDLKSVEASAVKGCKLCLMISRGPWQLGSRQMYISVKSLSEWPLEISNVTKDTTRGPWTIKGWMHGWLYHQQFLPFVQNVERQPRDYSQRQRQWYLRNTGSEKVMDTIRTWMSECLETHIPCARRTPSSLPTRVIDVGQADSSDDPYLLESSGQVAPYLALSYCWGTGKKFVSTRDSIARRREGFMLAELPETLRDAILVTRQSGVRYLWIDSLCIIQDDDNDWQSESSNMRAIYRNALFVISALDAAHSDSGMFFDRVALIASSDDTSPTTTGLYIREHPWSTHVSERLDQPHSLDERAWALQERFMATALLHFSRDIMNWECRTCSLFEDGTRVHNHPITKAVGRDDDVGRSIDARDWYHLVAQYRKRQLSHKSDKLAAIGGLATEFEEQGWCQGYLVGLWKSDICRGLLWGTSLNNEQAEQFAEHKTDPRFPSWSWTSSHTDTDWAFTILECERIRTRYDSDVESMGVELSDESKTATAVDGSITFKAFMVLLTYNKLALPDIDPSLPDQIFTRRKGGEFVSCHGWGHLDRPTTKPCWLARMATWWKQYGSEFHDGVSFSTFFLILEETRDGYVFRRVGTFFEDHDDPDEQLTINEMVWRMITII